MTASAGVLRSLTAGFVYFVQSGDRPLVKIGWATNPTDRINRLQCGNPDSLSILGLVAGTLSDELAWRKRFRHLLLRGEWFKLTDELRIAIDEREEVAQSLWRDRLEPDMPESWLRYKEMLRERRAAPLRGLSDKLDPDKVRAIRSDGRAVRAIAVAYGVSKTCVQDIRMNRTWRHVTKPSQPQGGDA